MDDLFHALSQPLTALEIGLEISLRQDHDVALLRSRVESALEIARTLHQKLAQFRRSMEAEQEGCRCSDRHVGRLCAVVRKADPSVATTTS